MVALCGCEHDRIEKIHIYDDERPQLKLNIKKAIADFERKRRDDPEDHRNLNLLGRAYQRTEQWEEMAAAFRDAATVAPAFANYWKGYGEALIELGRGGDRAKLEAAKGPLRECAKRDPNFAECFFYLGIAQEGLDEAQAALRSYSRAIRVDPRQSRFYPRLAELYIAHRYYDEADAVLSEAVRLLPELERTRNDLIAVHRRRSEISLFRGDQVGRIAALESASKLAGPNAEIEIELARAYRQHSPPKAEQAARVLTELRQRHCERENEATVELCREVRAMLHAEP